MMLNELFTLLEGIGIEPIEGFPHYVEGAGGRSGRGR